MESDENDNIYEKHFTWIVGKSDQIEIINYTEQELSGKLDKLEKLLTTRSVAINSDGIDFRNEILDVVDAGYYLVTGGSFLDERVDILILTRQDFLAWVDDYYSEQFALNDVSKYQSILDERQRVKERGSGLKTNRFGKDVIVVNGEYMIADVIGTSEFSPPSLNTQGSKVQPDWLFEFHYVLKYQQQQGYLIVS